MNSSAESRPLKRGEIAVLTVMFLVNITLGGFFLSQTGFKSYLAIFVFMTFAWLYGCYLGFKRGIMFGRGLEIKREDNPSRFYLNIGVLLVIYAFVLLFFVGIFLQQTGYLKR